MATPVRATIPVRVTDGFVDVRGVQIGDWAATPYLNWDNSTDDTRWRITHVPTGLGVSVSLIGHLEQADAERVAQALHDRGFTPVTTEAFCEPDESRWIIESIAGHALDEAP